MILLKFSLILLFQIFLISIITAQDAKKTIYDNVVADVPQLLALGVLLNKAPKFVATMSSKGPFTLFAPNNLALEALSATPEELEQILNHHLVQGKLLSGDFKSVLYPKTMLKIPPTTAKVEENIVLEKSPVGGMQIRSGWTASNILVVDQVASNGVIHIIDTVLGQPMEPIQTLSQNADFKSMVEILQNPKFANLATEIAKINLAGGDVTILALTNDVISNAPKDVAKHLEFINPIFSYHIIPNQIIYSGLIENALTAKTLKNELITFTRENGGLFVGNALSKAKITHTDILTYKGILHVLDNILIPPSVPISPEGSTTYASQPVPPTKIQTQPNPTKTSSTSSIPSPTAIPVTTTSPNIGVIVGSAIGGIIGGGLLMLGGFFFIYKRFAKKPKEQEELFPYYYDLGHNNINSSNYSNITNSNNDNYYSNSNSYNRQQSHYSNTSNDNFSIPTTTNTTNQSVYIDNE